MLKKTIEKLADTAKLSRTIDIDMIDLFLADQPGLCLKAVSVINNSALWFVMIKTFNIAP